MGLGHRGMIAPAVTTAQRGEPERAFADLVQLAGRIGERLAGTAGEQDGIAYLGEQFAAIGLEPRIEPVPVPIWLERRATLVTPERSIEALSPCFSGVTADGGGEGPLVAVGDPMRERDLDGLDLTGRIALIDGRDVQVDYPDYIQTDLLVARGVAGAVFAAGPDQRGGLPQAYYNFKRALHEPTPPSVIVSREDADWLVRNPGPARLEVSAEINWGVSANVWAEAPGADLADEIVLVAAHHDAVRGSPGASDNAGGCAIVAELARVIAGGAPPRRTIRFVHFGAHEVGLFGSESWLRAHARDIGRIVAVINFDGHGLVGGRDSASLLGGSGWVQLTETVLAQAGLPLDVRYDAAGGVGVDSVNFAALGRNAINFGNGGAPRAHTPADNLMPLGPAGLANALQMGEALMLAAANRDDCDLTAPSPARQVRETQAYCVRWGWGIAG
jgi:hypothetical protein